VRAFAKAFAGRWRIVETDNWDNDFLDLVEEAHLTFEVSPMAKLPSVRRRAFSTSATARETVRPASSSDWVNAKMCSCRSLPTSAARIVSMDEWHRTSR